MDDDTNVRGCEEEMQRRSVQCVCEFNGTGEERTEMDDRLEFYWRPLRLERVLKNVLTDFQAALAFCASFAALKTE
jgi:hypothetical protein